MPKPSSAICPALLLIHYFFTLTAGAQLKNDALILKTTQTFADVAESVATYDDLSDAVSKTGSIVRILDIPVAETVNDNLTVPENITLHFTGQGSITVQNGKTLIINGPIQAPLRQVFAGSGSVLLGSRIEKSYPQWFGAKGDVRVSEVASMNSGSSTIRCSDCNFTSSDVGKRVDVNSSGSQTALSANVAGVINRTTVVLSTAASFTLTNQTLTIRGVSYNDCATTAGSTTITSATANFAASDLGRPLVVTKAGRWNKAGIITAVANSTTATLSLSASGDVVNKRITFGTDDTIAITKAIAAGRNVHFVKAGYGLSTFSQTTLIAGNAQNGALKLNAPDSVLTGDGPTASKLYSIGPVANDANSYGTILLITNGASHSRVEQLGFIGTNALAQTPAVSAGICDGIFIGAAGTADDVRIQSCRFDNFWLIGMHAIGDGDIESGIKNITIDHCSANYNAFDGFNPSAGRGLRFTNNDMSYNGSGGFECGCGDAFIDNNKAIYTRGAGFSIGGFGDSAVATTNIVSNNIAKLNGSGFVFGSNIQQTIATSNIAMQNDIVGMQIQNGFGTLGKHGQLKHNIIVSNGGSGINSTAGLVLSAVSFWDVESNTITNVGISGYDQAIGVSLYGISDVRIIRNSVYGNVSHDYVSNDASVFTFYTDIAGADVSFGQATVTYQSPIFGRIISAGVAPTITAQSGLGTSPAVSVSGNDLAGTITLTVGSSPRGGAFVRLMFAAPVSSGSVRPYLFPVNPDAAAAMTAVYVSNQNGAFVEFAHSGSGLISGQKYIWNYLVMR
jgi:hypothetical protein